MYIRFGTIAEITRRMTAFNKSVLIENLIYEIYSFWMDETAEIITKEMDRLRVCYLTKKGIQRYKSKMNKNDYEYLSLYDNGIICAYILLTKYSVNNIRYIRFCQSIVSGLGIMYDFIEILEKKTKKMIIPSSSLEDAIPYWEKFFLKKYKITTKEELNAFIQNNNACISMDLYIT